SRSRSARRSSRRTDTFTDTPTVLHVVNSRKWSDGICHSRRRWPPPLTATMPATSAPTPTTTRPATGSSTLRERPRFIVHTGGLKVRRGRDRIRVGAGEEIRIPPKVVHTFQAETESTYTVEFRPGATHRGVLPRTLRATDRSARQSPHRRCRPSDARLPGRVPLL